VALTKGLDPIMALVYADLLVAGVCLSGLFPAAVMVQFSRTTGRCVSALDAENRCIRCRRTDFGVVSVPITPLVSADILPKCKVI
jgi:hypothetical protein